MKVRGFWGFGLGVAVVLFTTYALVGPAEEMPLVLSDADMESMYGSNYNAKCMDTFGCGKPTKCYNTGNTSEYRSNTTRKNYCYYWTGKTCHLRDVGQVCFITKYSDSNCGTYLSSGPVNDYRDCFP